MENSAYYKLGLNIRGLRKFWRLTQEELALAIGVTKQAISQYELGNSIPERDVLLTICRYFRITENELLNGKYDNMKSIASIPNNDKHFNSRAMDKMFPLISSESSLKNTYFKEAYEIHKTLYAEIMAGKDFDENSFDENLINKCLELYDKALETGVIEAAANSLWWILFIGFITTVFSPRMYEIAELFQESRISFKEFLLEGFLHPIDMDTNSEEYKIFENSRIEFLKEVGVDIFKRIKLLKLSKEYADLGDYYLAFIYIFNLIRNTESPEMNSAIGFELMNTYSLLGNPYAEKFCDK